jgi:hypothetical protein
VRETYYLVFGDLHGRILPAFRLACVWSREHGLPVTGLLQVGDLGFFPDPSRLDKATKRHAEKDPLELGAQQVCQPSAVADQVFGEAGVPEGLWFTAGNHEDFEALEMLASGGGRGTGTFIVDYYHRLRCIRDGQVASLPGGLRVGALWGIDDQAPNARRKTPPRGRIRARSATELACSSFDVLLTHESPRDAVFADSGSEEIDAIIHLARPAFAFFGHYGGTGRPIPGNFGSTQVFLLTGLELSRKEGCAEEGSVGALKWNGKEGDFEYLDGSWLRTFSRHNWRSR